MRALAASPAAGLGIKKPHPDESRSRRMKCPVCDIDLQMAERQGIEIDYCPKCRGVWLDRGELDKIIDRAADEYGPRGGREEPRDDERRPERRDEYRRDERGRDDDDRRDEYRRDDDYRRREEHYSPEEYRHKKRKKGGFLGEIFEGFGE
jgi:uncharacterized protein